jgi:hypothetical protein
MSLRGLLLVALVFGLILPFSAVQAQGVVEFETVQVAIWPEYDRPDVLVMYSITLADSVSLPAEASFLIPQAAGKPHAVAMKDVDGTLVDLTYSTAQEGDWIRLSFTTPTPDIQVEYYDPRLTKEGGNRSYTYSWPGSSAVRSMIVQVQQPLTATGMQFDRSLGSAQQFPDGLTYYQSNIGSVSQGTQFGFTMTYQKDDDVLSGSQQSVQPSEPITNQTTGRENFSERLPWIILGAVGVLLILGGLAWYWQTGKRRPAEPARQRHSGANRRGETQESEISGGAVYCSQCGKRAAAGDVFCRTCGTRLRG